MLSIMKNKKILCPVCFRVSPLGAKHNGKGKCDFQDGRATDYRCFRGAKRFEINRDYYRLGR